jgi:hypothetical protein
MLNKPSITTTIHRDTRILDISIDDSPHAKPVLNKIFLSGYFIYITGGGVNE